jgi:DNA-directed RNA polymerase beta subunit
MNIGQILECHMGWAAKQLVVTIATRFLMGLRRGYI